MCLGDLLKSGDCFYNIKLDLHFEAEHVNLYLNKVSTGVNLITHYPTIPDSLRHHSPRQGHSLIEVHPTVWQKHLGAQVGGSQLDNGRPEENHLWRSLSHLWLSEAL